MTERCTWCRVDVLDDLAPWQASIADVRLRGITYTVHLDCLAGWCRAHVLAGMLELDEPFEVVLRRLIDPDQQDTQPISIV